MRCHSAIHRRHCREEEVKALECKNEQHRKDPEVDAEPWQAQETQSVLHGSDGPIPVKEWQKLDLGRPALHSDEGSAVSPKAKDASERAPSQVRDGQLLKVKVQCYGHTLIALIDCGASRCYMDQQTVMRLGPNPVMEKVMLELGDGTKVLGNNNPNNASPIAGALMQVTAPITDPRTGTLIGWLTGVAGASHAAFLGSTGGIAR